MNKIVHWFSVVAEVHFNLIGDVKLNLKKVNSILLNACSIASTHGYPRVFVIQFRNWNIMVLVIRLVIITFITYSDVAMDWLEQKKNTKLIQ